MIYYYYVYDYVLDDGNVITYDEYVPDEVSLAIYQIIVPILESLTYLIIAVAFLIAILKSSGDVIKELMKK